MVNLTQLEKENDEIPCVTKEAAIYYIETLCDNKINEILYPLTLQPKEDLMLSETDFQRVLDLTYLGVHQTILQGIIQDYVSQIRFGEAEEVIIESDKNSWPWLISCMITSLKYEFRWYYKNDFLQVLATINNSEIRESIFKAYPEFDNSTLSRAIELNQFMQDYKLNYDQALTLRRTLSVLQIWICQGKQLKFDEKIFSLITSFIVNLTVDQAKDICEKTKFKTEKIFLEGDLKNCLNIKHSFFTPYKEKANTLLEKVKMTDSKQSLEELMKSQQKDGFYELVVEKHYTKLSN